MNNLPYRSYAAFLKETFGEKVYKVPIKLDLTCPNRDGNCGTGGCIFCGDTGGSFENLSEKLSVKEQLNHNREVMKKRFRAEKYIAYFQNFTNTYQPLKQYEQALMDVREEDVVGITVSTRPDYLGEPYLEATEKIGSGRMITFELGLQSANNQTLKIINRGHTVEDFISGAKKVKERGFRLCVHLILDLPWDEDEDILKAVELVNGCGVDEVKLHSLYVTHNTALARMLERGRVQLLTREDYDRRVILFLRHLHPHIVVQRLVGRAPEEETIHCNWNTSWWKIRDEIIEEMLSQGYSQGDLFPEKKGSEEC